MSQSEYRYFIRKKIETKSNLCSEIYSSILGNWTSKNNSWEGVSFSLNVSVHHYWP